MSKSKTREPKQQRSIEKKRKIVEAGLILFSEKGYHNTNTAEIAKKAGVSTGIVYNYFHDKKEIFMKCLDVFVGKVSNPLYEILESVENKEDLVQRLPYILDMSIRYHKEVRQAHHELEAMIHFDRDVAEYFKTVEEDMMENLVSILRGKGFQDPYLFEKVHIIYNMLEDVCHEIAFHQHERMNDEVMKQTIVDIISDIVRKLS